jgi:replicative DNA helicase
VAVDYLQIVPLQESESSRVSSTKEKVDLHVSALRRIARDLDSPVIAFSSENRAGYG